MPRGGRRVGAGRKPKHQSGKVLQHPSASVPVVPTTNDSSPIEEFDAPNDLSMDERAIWLKQAPHAFANRTLVRATAFAFERYCKLVVQERADSASSAKGGADHVRILKEVRAYEEKFLLIPCGRPMAVPVKPQAERDDDDAFFGGVGG